jgi:hypothetical protein
VSCDPSPAVHRTIDLPAPADEVWDEVVAGVWLGDDVEIEARPGGTVRVDDMVGVVETAEPGRLLTFWWTRAVGDEPPSRVDVEMLPIGPITRVWVRETQLDLDVRLMARARPFALSRA